MTSDERIARLEKWLSDLYRDAEKEMRGKWDAFMKELRAEGDKLLRAIDDAPDEATKKKARRAYTAYMRDATITDRFYRQMVDELARQYADAGRRAAEIVNGERFGAFADGYNLAAEKINNIAASRDIGIRFDLCDPNLIEYLERHSEDLLLPPKADPSDLDMTVWNVHNINAQVTQGIVQGEGPDKVAERLKNVTRMNEAAAIRTARTMMIGSRNAGYLQSLENAEEWGVNLKKVWYCRHDSKTRDSHLALDGIGVKTDEKFPNECRFPGDPEGPAEEIYNCRCRMESELRGFSSTLPKGKAGAIRVTVDGERLEQGRSYYESPTKSRSADEYRAWAEERKKKRQTRGKR